MYFQNEKYFDLQKWHQNVQLQVFIQANVTVGEKAKNLARTTTPAKWQFYKGVLWDEHLPNTTTFERSQEWLSYTGLTAFKSTFNHLHQFFLGISWSQNNPDLGLQPMVKWLFFWSLFRPWPSNNFLASSIALNLSTCRYSLSYERLVIRKIVPAH